MNQIHTPVSTDIPELALNRPVLTLEDKGWGCFPVQLALDTAHYVLGKSRGKPTRVLPGRHPKHNREVRVAEGCRSEGD